MIDKVLNGNINAFNDIIKKSEGLVAHIVFKMIPNPSARKDLAQDIYLKAYKSLGSFRFHSKLSTWIGQIAYNTCYHYLDKKNCCSWKTTPKTSPQTKPKLCCTGKSFQGF